MSENNIQNIMEITLDKLRAAVSADTIIGDPIVSGDVTLLPVSKLSFGVASGGADYESKTARPLFGGGGGAGVSVTPVAFLAIKQGDVKLLQIYKESNAADRAVTMIPELFEKIKAMFKKND